jgi:peptidoglycan hydrolase-like protein with peptidoglycan-binding domain
MYCMTTANGIVSTTPTPNAIEPAFAITLATSARRRTGTRFAITAAFDTRVASFQSKPSRTISGVAKAQRNARIIPGNTHGIAAKPARRAGIISEMFENG